MLQFLAPIVQGLGSALGAGAAGAAGSGIMAKLAPMALQAGIGYALGGPQGAMQLPLMGMAAGQSQGPGIGMSGLNPASGAGGLLGMALGDRRQLLAPILGGLAGRAFGGGPGGGLMGMGYGGLLDPSFGPFAEGSRQRSADARMGDQGSTTRHSSRPDPFLRRIPSPGMNPPY